MEVAPPGFFDGLTPLKTPASGPSPALSAGPGSVPLPEADGPHYSLGRLSDVLPPLDGTPGASSGDALQHGPRGTPPGSQDRPARRREGSHAQARLRRKKVQLDVDASGRPATELPGGVPLRTDAVFASFCRQGNCHETLSGGLSKETCVTLQR